MSAIVELFPSRGRLAIRGTDVSLRYVRRAQEAFDLLAQASTDLERGTLCDIAEIWLDMAEAALPTSSAQP